MSNAYAFRSRKPMAIGGLTKLVEGEGVPFQVSEDSVTVGGSGEYVVVFTKVKDGVSRTGEIRCHAENPVVKSLLVRWLEQEKIKVADDFFAFQEGIPVGLIEAIRNYIGLDLRSCSGTVFKLHSRVVVLSIASGLDLVKAQLAQTPHEVLGPGQVVRNEDFQVSGDDPLVTTAYWIRDEEGGGYVVTFSEASAFNLFAFWVFPTDDPNIPVQLLRRQQ
jgi:hypothetical protein